MQSVFEAKISVKGYFIYGFPHETDKDIELTYSLACEIKDLSIRFGTEFRTSIFQYRPYHGTDLYNELMANNPSCRHDHVTHNMELSKLIGRDQYNFQSINYSKASLRSIHDYICKTSDLNGANKLLKQRTIFKKYRHEKM